MSQMFSHVTGWVFYFRHHGRTHIVLENQFVSLCGHYKIEYANLKKFTFRKTGEFPEKKKCGHCLNYAEQRGIPIP